VELVGSIKRKGKNGDGRRPFKLTELQSLFRAASGEWPGLILFGLYTGQRLGDIALPVTDDARAPLFPKAFQTVSVQCDRVGTLSNQFYEVMVEAGLVPARSHAK
jgi:hypothetical protein